MRCLRSLCPEEFKFEISKTVTYSIGNTLEAPFPHLFTSNHFYGINLKDEQLKTEIAGKFQEKMLQVYPFGSSKRISFFELSKDPQHQLRFDFKYPNISYQNLVDLEGKNIQLVCNQGEITVLDFWVPW